MKKLVLAALLVVGSAALAAAALAGGGKGNGGHSLSTKMNGYNETTGATGAGTGSISTTGKGSLKLRIRSDGIHFRLRYSGMEGATVTQAHIHFAQRHVAGGIIAFLCGGTGPEAPCTAPNGDISGVITPAEIIGPADQGIPAGATGFADAVKAIKAGATYANVHSSTWPEGEIRGQLDRKRGDD